MTEENKQEEIVIENDLKVRRLKSGDFLQVASMIGQMSTDVIRNMSSTTTEYQAGILFLSAALKQCKTEIRVLLADLLEGNVTVEEFEKMPFDTPIKILDKVAEQENMQQVFLQLKGLMKKFIGK